MRRAAAPALPEPRPAAQHAAIAVPGAGRVAPRADGVVVAIVPVGAPLQDVAVHVEKPGLAGLVGADGGGTVEERSLGGGAVGEVAVEVGLLAAEGGAE